MNERSMIKNFEPSGFKVPIRRELLDNWNQEKEIKKRVILVEKMVEKKWHSHLYFLPTISRNDVKSGVNEKIYSQTHIIE